MTHPHYAEASQDKDEQWLLEEKYAGQETEEFEADKKRLASGEPLGYVIGWQPFLGLKIHLDSHPLIPRVETEWWVDRMLTNAKTPQSFSFEEVPQRDGARPSKFSAENYASPKTEMPAGLRILDLCSGSGAIGCAALAKLPNARVYFGEIDPAHEATILKNIRENNLDESRADVRIGDLFEPFAGMQFDIIASNPPYIPANRELPESVAAYEPSRALFAGDDGLAIIRRIAEELPKHLAPGGQAWIEVDSAHAAAPTLSVGAPTPGIGAACALFTDQSLTAEILPDQYAQPRVVRVEKCR